MSTALRVFRIESEGQRIDPLTPDKQILSRIHYGIPAEVTAELFLDRLASIDNIKRDYTPQNALNGVNLGFLFMDILREEREPQVWTETDSGLQVPKPFIFAPNTAVLDGVLYALDEFAPRAEGFSRNGDNEGLYLAYDNPDKKIHNQLFSTSSRDELNAVADGIGYGNDGEFQAFCFYGRSMIRRVRNT